MVGRSYRTAQGACRPVGMQRRPRCPGVRAYLLSWRLSTPCTFQSNSPAPSPPLLLCRPHTAVLAANAHVFTVGTPHKAIFGTKNLDRSTPSVHPKRKVSCYSFTCVGVSRFCSECPENRSKKARRSENRCNTSSTRAVEGSHSSCVPTARACVQSLDFISTCRVSFAG